jgi:hypothetical protein
MSVYHQAFTPEIVAETPETLFVFPDNAERNGCSDAFEAMRRLPNALGIVVKRSADRAFDDAEFEENLDAMAEGFETVWAAAEEGRDIVFHSDFAADFSIFGLAPKARDEFFGMLKIAGEQAASGQIPKGV